MATLMVFQCNFFANLHSGNQTKTNRTLAILKCKVGYSFYILANGWIWMNWRFVQIGLNPSGLHSLAAYINTTDLHNPHFEVFDGSVLLNRIRSVQEFDLFEVLFGRYFVVRVVALLRGPRYQISRSFSKRYRIRHNLLV